MDARYMVCHCDYFWYTKHGPDIHFDLSYDPISVVGIAFIEGREPDAEAMEAVSLLMGRPVTAEDYDGMRVDIVNGKKRLRR